MTFSCLIKQFIEGALNWLMGVKNRPALILTRTEFNLLKTKKKTNTQYVIGYAVVFYYLINAIIEKRVCGWVGYYSNSAI